MVSSEQFQKWLTVTDESETIEFKEARNTFDRERLYKYCVAIANEGGGHLVLGISDKKPRTFVGTNAFNNIGTITEKIFQKIKFRVNIFEYLEEDSRALVFEIPGRPSGSAYGYEGAYLMRSGESLVAMSEDRLRIIFAEGGPDWVNRISLDNVSQQEVINSLDTQTFFELLGKEYPTNQDRVIEELLTCKLINKLQNGYAIRRIGALLLAKNMAEFPDIERKTTRVIVYNGRSKLNTKIDRYGQKGYAAGFQGLIRFIMDQLPQNEVIEDALRKTIKLIPEVAIREIAANALIHQDFEMTGMGPTIEIYDDRVEISNPGEAIVPVDRFIDAHRSRNEDLADIMRRVKICEEKGSGLDRVVMLAETHQLPAPEFVQEYNRVNVVVYGNRNFSKMSKEDRVRACYQHCSLRRVLRDYMTNKSLRERFGLPAGKASQVSQIIAATVDRELVKSDESMGDTKKYARYIPFWA